MDQKRRKHFNDFRVPECFCALLTALFTRSITGKIGTLLYILSVTDVLNCLGILESFYFVGKLFKNN